MANQFLFAAAGQSLLGSNPDADVISPPLRTLVNTMMAGTRSLSPFDTSDAWNAWDSNNPGTDSPILRVGDEWEARESGGHQSLGGLSIVSVLRNGGSFSVTNPVDNSSQWNLDKRRNASGAWDSTLYDTPAESEGVWATGSNYSCVDTLTQCLSSAVSEIQGGGDTVYFLGVLFALGQGDALTTTGGNEFYSNLIGLRQLCCNALGVSNIPWHNLKLSGGALLRDGAAAVNSAMDAFAAQFDNSQVIDPTKFAEYNPEDTDAYGGIHGPDGVHLSNRGCWRVAEKFLKFNIDRGFYGVQIPVA